MQRIPHARASTKSATIDRLIKAAREEFAAKGIARARIESIARAAGVTKQLVYHYYESKEALFSVVLDDASAKAMPKLVAMTFDDVPPVDALRALLQEVFDQYRSEPLLGPLAREGLRHHEEHRSSRPRFLEIIPVLIAKFQHILERGVNSGDFRADVDARASLAAAVLMYTGGLANRLSMSAILGFDTSSKEGMEAWSRIASEFVLNALRPTEDISR
jgi:AcrR family transcriptional regulator